MKAQPLKVRFQVACDAANGLGHLRRSLVLAQAFRQMGAEVSFGVTDPGNAAIAQDYSIETLPVGSIRADSHAYDVIVIDGYNFTADDLNSWKRSGKISVVIDDLGNAFEGFDVIVNPNLYAGEIDYSNSADARILAGPAFNLIDPGFFQDPNRTLCKSGVVVTFGGGDKGEKSAEIAVAIAQTMNRQIYCPLPMGATPHAALIAASEKYPNIQPAVGVDMRDILLKSALYIGALGVTVSEAIVADCQIIACSVASNQDLNLGFLRGRGADVFEVFDCEGMVDAALSGSVEKISITELNGSGATVVVRQILSMP